jgi:hypothetical protein
VEIHTSLHYTILHHTTSYHRMYRMSHATTHTHTTHPPHMSPHMHHIYTPHMHHTPTPHAPRTCTTHTLHIHHTCTVNSAKVPDSSACSSHPATHSAVPCHTVASKRPHTCQSPSAARRPTPCSARSCGRTL